MGRDNRIIKLTSGAGASGEIRSYAPTGKFLGIRAPLTQILDDYLDIGNLQRLCVNVLAYGADRTGAEDSTSAVQAAVNAAAALGARVFFPDGDYKYGTITVNSPVTVEFEGGIHTALAHPLWSVGAIKNVHFIGRGKDLTKFVAAAAAGYVFSINGSATNDNFTASMFSISGNGTASGGILVKGTRNGYWFDRVWSYGFSAGRALSLEGCNRGTFLDCDFTDSAYGAYFTEYTGDGGITYSTANLNQFFGGSISANAVAIYSYNPNASGNSCNQFDGVNIASNTSSPCIQLITAINWSFDGCYWEGNAGGDCVIQLGDATHSADRCSFFRNYVSESNTITSWILISKGEGNKVCFNSKVSQGTVTNLVGLTSLATKSMIFGNLGNYPWTEWAWIGGAGTEAPFSFGHETSDFYKSVSAPEGYILQKPLKEVSLAASCIPHTVKAHASQSADLTQYTDSAGGVLSAIDKDGMAIRGVRTLIPFQLSVPNGMADTKAKVCGDPTQTAIRLPRAGSIVGISLWTSGTMVSGTITAAVYKNSATTWFSTSITNGTDQSGATQAKDADTFAAITDYLEINISASGTINPNPTQIYGLLEIET